MRTRLRRIRDWLLETQPASNLNRVCFWLLWIALAVDDVLHLLQRS